MDVFYLSSMKGVTFFMASADFVNSPLYSRIKDNTLEDGIQTMYDIVISKRIKIYNSIEQSFHVRNFKLFPEIERYSDYIFTYPRRWGNDYYLVHLSMFIPFVLGYEFSLSSLILGNGPYKKINFRSVMDQWENKENKIPTLDINTDLIKKLKSLVSHSSFRKFLEVSLQKIDPKWKENYYKSESSKVFSLMEGGLFI